jgi:dolichol kinase
VAHSYLLRSHISSLWTAEKTVEGTIAGFLSMLAGLLVVQWGFGGGGLEVKPVNLNIQ